MIEYTVLAHQGGWDEILIIIGPIAAIVGIVALVRRRLQHEDQTDSDVANSAVASGTDAVAS